MAPKTAYGISRAKSGATANEPSSVNKIRHTMKSNTLQRPLRVGFVPLTDCAPLAVAHEFGMFRKYGLKVALSRELGWATIRDKIIQGELDAAHALAAMPLAATLGLGSIRCECLTGLVLNLHGNAITLSNELWRRGVRDGQTLRAEIRRAASERVLTFGVVYPFSSHRHLLRAWLGRHGIDPERDARIVVVPPSQMTANLKAGHLDGFCVGEPWNSMAVREKAGWVAATSVEFDPGHPEKVVMVRNEFATTRAEEHVALLAALLEACAFCDKPENREAIIDLLSRTGYVGVPADVLRRAFSGEFDFGHGEIRRIPNFCVFHRESANEPSSKTALWALQLARASGLCGETGALDFSLGKRVFREDIYSQAVQRFSTQSN